MHRRWQPIVVLAAVLGVALLLGGCGLVWVTPTHREPTLPTIGPVVNRASGDNNVAITFSASTNCAEPGEVITFTLQITNTTTYPVTITQKPLLDIELYPRVIPKPKPIPVQRWSESDQYPVTIKPVLAPGEVRHYEWRWTAEQRYVPKASQDLGGIRALFRSGNFFTPTLSDVPGWGSEIYVGIGGMERPEPGGGNGWFECREMPRPTQ